MSFTLAFTACVLCSQATSYGENSHEWDGPILPAPEAAVVGSHWLVGVIAERFGTAPNDSDGLYGVGATYRTGPLGPHAFLMTRPADHFNELRTQIGLGLRSYFTLLKTEWTFGVGAHLEVRLEDHFWLAYATPIELGSELYAAQSWKLQLFVGARRAFEGQLIDHFLIDPNGFDSASARDHLDRVTRQQPWLAFARLSFSRIVQ